ncbi:MAG: SurA N-terminal domain-containing protein [Burkholderiales bacterium]|nr:SurA N-terminal domain-containing protein [Burkholderiales bacterium]
MFDLVHKHKLILQIFLGLIGLSFALWGVESYRGVFGSSDAVADVGGIQISQREFGREFEQQRERLAAMLGKSFDPTAFDTVEMRRQLLDGMISQRVLAAYASRYNMAASDQQLRGAIAGVPAFHEDGKFSLDRYRSLLRAQNLTEAEFERGLRGDLVMQQLSSGIADSAFASRAVARYLAAARAQSRAISEQVYTPEQFRGQVKLTPDAVEAYYKANPKAFEAPEQVRAEFVVLSRDAMAEHEKVSADEVRAYYEQTMAPRFKQRAEARRKIDALLAEVKKNPDRFAELAKENSQDPGSAREGGSLGFFARGSMVKPFEDAAFKLKPGEISPVVETEFGFHILKLNAVRKGEGGAEERSVSHILITAPKDAKDFDAARGEIEAELKRQRILKKFPEAAESFSNMAYEQPDSLQPLAERFGLRIEHSGWLTREGGEGAGPFANPRLRGALFTDDSIRNKRNTEAIEVSPGTLVAARVVEHKPAALRPLDEVRAEIGRMLIDREAQKLAREAGEAKLAELRDGKDAGIRWPAAKTVSREQPAELDRGAQAAVFGAEVSKLPAYAGVSLGDKGYALYRISSVANVTDPDERRLAASQFGLARQEAREDYQSFVDGLRERTSIKINEQNLAPQGRGG